MPLQAIYTDRSTERRTFYQIVFEWEDDFAAALGLPLSDHRPGLWAKSLVQKLTGKWHSYRPLQVLDRLTNRRGTVLYFDMGPRWTYGSATMRHVLPVIIDYWKYIDTRRFEKVYRNCPLVCITSLEAYQHLKQQGCRLPLAHLPLSLPDRYRIGAGTPAPQKDIDIISVGRINPVFKSFLEEYLKEFPGTSYLVQDFADGKPVLRSNAAGVPESMDDRADYMKLLRRGRVAFYSTPGIDGGEGRTGGFNPVTPRMFEFLSAGCHLVGRYPKTAETDFFRLPDICAPVPDYAAFRDAVRDRLRKAPPMAANAAYLEDHYASVRARQLQTILTKTPV